MRLLTNILFSVLLCIPVFSVSAEVYMIGDRVDVEQKTEARFDVPDGCVITGIGFRAHADNITTMHLRYHRLTPAGELIDPATVHVGSEPDHACEAKIYLPEGYVMVGFGAGAAPEWDIRTLRVWGRPLKGDGTLGDAEVFEDGRSPKDGLERVVHPTEPDRVLVGAGLRLVLHDIAGIYGRTKRVVEINEEDREKLAGLETRGWMLERATPEFVEQAVDRAPEFGVGLLVLSLPPEEGGSTIPQSQSGLDDLDAMVKRTSDGGLECRLAIGLPDLAPPDAEDYQRTNIGKVLWNTEEIEGVVVDVPAGAPAGSEAVRITERLRNLADTCKVLGKSLAVRVNPSGPDDIPEVVSFVESLPPADLLLPVTAGRFDPFFPPNPLLGTFPDRNVLVEMDLGERNSGRCLVPYARPGETQSQVVAAGLSGAGGVIARIGEPGLAALGSMNEFNLWSLGRLLEDPLQPLNPLWDEYFTTHYEEAAGNVVSAFRRTRSAVNMTYHVGDFSFISEGSRIPGIARAEERLRNGVAEWRPDLEPAREDLGDPTTKVLDRALDENEIVEWLLKQSIADVESVRDRLPEGESGPMTASFGLLNEMGQLWRDWTRVYFLTEIYARDASGRTLGALEGARDELKERFAATQAKVGEALSLGDIDAVVAEVNSRIEETKKAGPIVRAFQAVEQLEDGGKPDEAAQALCDLMHDERFVPYLGEHNERLCELTSRMKAFGGPLEGLEVKRGGDGTWDIEEKDGKWCWASTPKCVVIYFDALYGPYEKPKEFVLTFEYFDEGEHDLYLHYDSDYPGGTEERQYHPVGPITIHNTEEWKEGSFVLDKALFSNSENMLADMRFLQGRDILRVRNVKLKPQ